MRYFKHKEKFLPWAGKDISYIGLELLDTSVTYFFTDGTKATGQKTHLWTLKAIDGFLKSGYWIEIFPEYPKYFTSSDWSKTAYVIVNNKRTYTCKLKDGAVGYTIADDFEDLYGVVIREGDVKQVSKEEAEKLIAPKKEVVETDVLSPIDPSSIKVGMYVTALSRKNMEDRSYRGDVLKVKSIALPFIVIQTKYGPASLDTREWNLAQLPQSYVNAMKKD